MNNDISKPHDSFWRKMMQHQRTAREFFELHAISLAEVYGSHHGLAS